LNSKETKQNIVLKVLQELEKVLAKKDYELHKLEEKYE